MIFHVAVWTINQDLLLGNADRLPIQSLGWRGNPANTIWTHGRCVPIDAAVARRPPKLLVRDMDQKATGRASECFNDERWGLIKNNYPLVI